MGRAKLVAGRRVIWPHRPEPAGGRCWHPGRIPGGANHLAFTATGATGKYPPPPAAQIRIPKAETRKKAETRRRKPRSSISGFGFRPLRSRFGSTVRVRHAATTVFGVGREEMKEVVSIELVRRFLDATPAQVVEIIPILGGPRSEEWQEGTPA